MKHSGFPLVVSTCISARIAARVVACTAACIVACLFCVSCTQQIVIRRVPPVPVSFTELKERLDDVHGLVGSATVRLKTSAKTQEGSASIILNGDDFDVRVYSMGILSGELSGKKGKIESDPDVGGDEKIAFARAIREGLMWWHTSAGSKTEETDDRIIIKDPGYVTIINRSTMEPIRQTLFLKDGTTVKIDYGDLRWVQGVLFPYRIVAAMESEELSITFDEIKLNYKLN